MSLRLRIAGAAGAAVAVAVVLAAVIVYLAIRSELRGEVENGLRVYVGYLRRKLEEAGARPLIHTIRGVGYVLREP